MFNSEFCFWGSGFLCGQSHLYTGGGGGQLTMHLCSTNLNLKLGCVIVRA